jgi:O-antigen ligase/tetratricopeptide (TPR) repeat protein
MAKTTNATLASFNLNYLAVVLIAIVLFAPWFNAYTANYIFIKSSVASLGLSALFLWQAWKSHQVSQISINPTFLKTGLFLLFLLGAISIFWADNIGFGVSKFLLTLNTFFAFILISNTTLNRQNLAKFSLLMLWIGVIIALIGISQYLFNADFLSQGARPGATFGNKNMASQIMVLILPISIFYFAQQNSTRLKTLLTGLGIAAIFIYIFYTKTRGLWLGALLELILIALYLFFNRQKTSHLFIWNSYKKTALIVFGVVFFIMINLSNEGLTPFWQVAADRFSSIERDALALSGSHTNARYQIWLASLEMIKSAPIFGSGLGSFIHLENYAGFGNHYVFAFQRVHNDIIELGVELGLVGVGLFFIVIIALIMSLIKILKSTLEDKFFYYLLMVALVGSFINMQFSFPYQLALPLVIFGLYAGILSKSSELSNTKPLPKISLTRKILLPIAGLIFTIIVIIYTSWFNAYNNIYKLEYDINNRWHQEQKFSLTTDTWLEHKNMPHMLNAIANNLYQSKLYKTSVKLDTLILEKHPNDLRALTRKSLALLHLKRYKKAFITAESLQKILPNGLYNGYFNQISILQEQHKNTETRPIYERIKSHKESYLKLDSNTYKSLHIYAIENQLKNDALYFYQKYTQYHGYHCSVENNMAVFYAQQKQHELAQKHIDIVLKKEPKCANQQVVKFLKSYVTK